MATVSQIYQHHGVLLQLQFHMLRVAGVAELILQNWSGPPVDRNPIIRVLLLHDIGNLVKMPSDPSESSLTARVRAEYQAQYGNDDHVVSLAIARGLGLSDGELSLMEGKVFVKNPETAQSNDYARKIGAYADQRVAPDGVVSLESRLQEAQTRYRNKPGSSMNNARTEEFIRLAGEIEEQVMCYCALSPQDITEEVVAPLVEWLSGFEI